MDIRTQIADLAAPGATAAGLVVDAVEIGGTGKLPTVSVVVDLPRDQIGSASIDAISQAAKLISSALDDSDVMDSAFTLEVTTPGTDRPLTEPHHFMRARTRLVSVELTDGAHVTGRLVEADNERLDLDVDGATREIALTDVVAGRIEIEFTRAGG